MSRLFHYASHVVGVTPEQAEGVVKSNHFASTTVLTADTKKKIASMGLERVAGNVYENKSTRDFWQVTSGGGIKRLCSGEVDNNERIAAAPTNAPADFLDEVLGSLEF
jgi:hypothetical protein